MYVINELGSRQMDLRTLGALFSDNNEDNKANDQSGSHDFPVTEVNINTLIPNNYQPRKYFNEPKLNELRDSIVKQGIIQPLIVRPLQDNTNKYEIIAGERRWRASMLANLQTIPVNIIDVDNRTSACFSIIENIQRENLNPIEEAMGFERLINEFHLSHDEVAKQVGKPRSTISNSIRLLSLCEFVKEMIAKGDLSAGHGKLLVTFSHSKQELLAKRVIYRGWSVRKLEEYLAAIPKKEANNKIIPLFSKKELQFFSEELTNAIGGKTKVELNRTGKGRVVIDIESKEIIENMLGALRDKKI